MNRRNRQRKPDSLLAFCHIEKAAGTSLTHVLRRIFFLRYAAVRPMRSSGQYYFTSRDLEIVRRLNPCLLGIGGHSVVPHGDLVHRPGQLRFITQVREPIGRAASQYRYWVSRLKLNADPNAYLEHPQSRNFQVKKLAGCEDLDLAKENVSKHFLLAGTVKQFDQFLVLLASKLDLPLHLFTYTRRNVDANTRKYDLPDDFHDRLRERNQLDQLLYDWVEQELFPAYVREYPGDFSSDLESFQSLKESGAEQKMITVLDYMYRNAYLKPVSGLIRLYNGLPYAGSYSTG